MALDLKQVRLEELSDVRYSFLAGKHPGKSYSRDVLVIRFEGTFGHGCAGNSDAVFMVAMGKAAIEAFEPSAVIIDLSELSYQWGDMMDSVLGIGDDCNMPSAVIVGSKCRAAIGTLCFGENATTDACEQESIFDSLTDAWNYVTKLLDEAGTPRIHEAAESGDIERLKQLLELGENSNRLDSSNNTPLHVAANPSIVKLLIEQGANVSARNSHGVTPLHLVKDVESARLLLNAGADPDARSSSNSSPLSHARSAAVAKLLIDAGADVLLRERSSLLHHVKSPEIAKLLIEAGANVNGLDESGRTPLDRVEESYRIFYRQAHEYGVKDHAEVARQCDEIGSLLRENGGKNGSNITT